MILLVSLSVMPYLRMLAALRNMPVSCVLFKEHAAAIVMRSLHSRTYAAGSKAMFSGDSNGLRTLRRLRRIRVL